MSPSASQVSNAEQTQSQRQHSRKEESGSDGMDLVRSLFDSQGSLEGLEISTRKTPPTNSSTANLSGTTPFVQQLIQENTALRDAVSQASQHIERLEVEHEQFRCLDQGIFNLVTAAHTPAGEGPKADGAAFGGPDLSCQDVNAPWHEDEAMFDHNFEIVNAAFRNCRPSGSSSPSRRLR